MRMNDVEMELEKLRRLWCLSTVPTHSPESLKELHELVREAVYLLADCGNCIYYTEYGREHCNPCVHEITNNFELIMD